MTLTAGQEALREAARLETARVYGGVVPEHKSRPLLADRAEAEINAAWHAPHQPGEGQGAVVLRATEPIEVAVREGWPTSRILDSYGVSYAEVRAVRKRLMADGAA